MNAEPAFALVVPFFNEERNVKPVCHELKKTLQERLVGGELVLIDDGSNDTTGAILDELAADWPGCRVYHLERNQGQAAALLFAFSKTTAPVIVTMDGDGQNDPCDIPKLLAQLDKADMVVGARVARKDSWVRRYISRVANRVRANCLGDGVSDSGCALKVFRREVASAFIPIRTLYSFMPALAVAAGFRVTEEPVNHRCREHGRSRYTVRSFLLLPIIDFLGVAWFSSRRCNRGSRELPALDANTFGNQQSLALSQSNIDPIDVHAITTRQGPPQGKADTVATDDYRLSPVSHEPWLA